MTDSTPPPDRPPLWVLMARVFSDDVGTIELGHHGHAYGVPDRGTWAAELRALADAVVPEEPEPRAVDSATLANWTETKGRWNERQRIRALLLAEAQRAESGT